MKMLSLLHFNPIQLKFHWFWVILQFHFLFVIYLISLETDYLLSTSVTPNLRLQMGWNWGKLQMGVNHNCCCLKLQTLDPFEEIFYQFNFKIQFYKIDIAKTKTQTKAFCVEEMYKKVWKSYIICLSFI